MIFKKINADIVEAMKSNNTVKRDALKYLKSNIQRVAKDSKTEENDDMCVSVAKKLIKQNIDAIELVNNKESLMVENEFWKEYLPRILSVDETTSAVEKFIVETGASSMRDMGKVMGALKQEYGQTMDMGVASQIVKERLS